MYRIYKDNTVYYNHCRCFLLCILTIDIFNESIILLFYLLYILFNAIQIVVYDVLVIKLL